MGGYEPDMESGIKIARALEKSGVDLLHVSFGMESFLKTGIGRVTSSPPGI